jgi:putative FmdB family regulatory protein
MALRLFPRRHTEPAAL